jgi:hypothetical protein
MFRFAIALSAALAFAACSATPDRPGRVLHPVAEPSAVIAAELAFARMAREKGTWTAFRATSTRDALWPAPRWQNVHEGLRGQADPPQAIVWGPDLAWSSCDGSFALSTGPATYPDGRRTRFATIWQRQSDGEYRWVLDQGFDLEAGYAAPEMIPAKVADCPTRRGPTRIDRLPQARRGEVWHSGRSDDGTLEWTTDLRADCSRVFTVRAATGGTVSEVFRRVSAAPAARTGSPAPSC